jgi:hypothetical protein
MEKVAVGFWFFIDTKNSINENPKIGFVPTTIPISSGFRV